MKGSGRQLESELQTDRHVFGEAGIHSRQAHIAERRMVDRPECSILTERAEVAVPQRRFNRESPIAVDHVLQAQRVEARADFAILVCLRRSTLPASPVLPLVHIIVVEKNAPPGRNGHHPRRADGKNIAAAGAGERCRGKCEGKGENEGNGLSKAGHIY